MKEIKTILIILLSINWSNASSQQTVVNERTYEETLQEYFDVTGTNPKELSQISSMIGMIGGSNYINSEEFELTMERILDKLFLEMIPIYKANFSQETLEELIVFFKSPLGKTYITTNKKIALESIKVSSEMSMEMIKEMTKGISIQKDK